MAVLNILEFPDKRLRNVAREVEQVDARVKTLVKDMLETMYEAQGIGLAASQVDVHERVVVIDVSDERDQPLVFINPKLTPLTDEMFSYQEGCLSVPGFYEDVTRPSRVKIEALNEQGEAFEMEADGLLAVCIQHECDHLAGKLFVDYLSNLKRDRIQRKLEKIHRQQLRAS
ncbi:MAG: peptide deformylase [Litorivicinus sp.]